jgi:hypothetical protein
MSASWSLFTWNTQGNFTAGPKLLEINALVGRGRVIGFLQEGGVDNAGPQDRWLAFGGTGVGSFNERCTNYVLVDATYARLMRPKPVLIESSMGDVLVGGGMAGRTAAAVGLGDTLFISWHSLSAGSNDDTARLIWMLEENYAQTYSQVIIGGDFNSDPASITELLAAGTVRKKAAWKYKTRTVFSSGAATHHSMRWGDHELDFFIALSTSVGATFAPPVGAAPAPVVTAVVPSDHNPVSVTLWL